MQRFALFRPNITPIHTNIPECKTFPTYFEQNNVTSNLPSSMHKIDFLSTSLFKNVSLNYMRNCFGFIVCICSTCYWIIFAIKQRIISFLLSFSLFLCVRARARAHRCKNSVRVYNTAFLTSLYAFGVMGGMEMQGPEYRHNRPTSDPISFSLRHWQLCEGKWYFNITFKVIAQRNNLLKDRTKVIA